MRAGPYHECDGVGAELSPLLQKQCLLLPLDSQAHNQALGKVKRQLLHLHSPSTTLSVTKIHNKLMSSIRDLFMQGANF